MQTQKVPPARRHHRQDIFSAGQSEDQAHGAADNQEGNDGTRSAGIPRGRHRSQVRNHGRGSS